MAFTLRALAILVAGSYRDPHTDVAYAQQELLRSLPPSVLDQRVELEKLEPGSYIIRRADDGAPLYELLSRRRGTR